MDVVLTKPLSVDPSFAQLHILRRCQELHWVAIRVSRSTFISFILPETLKTGSWNSVIEIQAFLATLVQKFDVSHADHQPQIKRARPGTMFPLVLGEEYKGPQFPLKITALRNT